MKGVRVQGQVDAREVLLVSKLIKNSVWSRL